MASPTLRVACGAVLFGAIAIAGACANGGGVDDVGGSGGTGGSITGVNASSSHAASSSTHSAASSTSVGVSSSSSSSSSSAQSSSASTGTGGPTCTDTGPGEPNDTMATAHTLSGIDDCDSSGTNVSGMLGQGGNDVDWYKYAGDDTFGCSVDPTRQLSGPGLRICKYAQCADGSTPDVTCPSGTTTDNQGGKPGCCWVGTSPETVDIGCSSGGLGDDSATIWIRVDHPGGVGCEPYTIAYHF